MANAFRVSAAASAFALAAANVVTALFTIRAAVAPFSLTIDTAIAVPSAFCATTNSLYSRMIGVSFECILNAPINPASIGTRLDPADATLSNPSAIFSRGLAIEIVTSVRFLIVFPRPLGSISAIPLASAIAISPAAETISPR